MRSDFGHAYRTTGASGVNELVGAGYSMKRHRDDGKNRVQPHYSMVYVLTGHGQFTNATGNTMPLRPGSFFQRYPDRPHTLVLDTDTLWTEVYIALSPRLFNGLRDMQLLSDDNQVGYVGVKTEVLDDVCNLRDELQDCSDQHLRPLAFKAIRLVCDLLESATPFEETPLTASEEIVERACAILSQNLAETVDLKTLCRDEGWGYERFRKLFSRKMGVSPHQYRIRRRLDAACRMLAAGDENVTGIAYALGYASPQDLSAQFKKHLGIPPSQFRQ